MIGRFPFFGVKFNVNFVCHCVRLRLGDGKYLVSKTSDSSLSITISKISVPDKVNIYLDIAVTVSVVA